MVNIRTLTFVMDGNVLTSIKFDWERYARDGMGPKTEIHDVLTPPTP